MANAHERIINRYKYFTVGRDSGVLYGLWRLREFAVGDRIFLCQGEDDVLTLWHANLPAVGVGSESGWRYDYWMHIVPDYSEIIVIPHRNPEGFALVRQIHANAFGSDFEHKLRFVVLSEERAIFTANDLWISVDADAERFRAELAACETLGLRDAFVDATWKCVAHEIAHASALGSCLHKTQLRLVDDEIRVYFRDSLDFQFFSISNSRRRFDALAEMLRRLTGRENAPVMLVHDPDGRARLAIHDEV